MALSSMAFLYVGPAVSAPTHASGSALLAATESNTATNSVHLKAGAEIHSVLVHPLFEKTCACVEHGADSLQWYLGDALGADCTSSWT
jgi:hypothetical protein